jgi:hypothetical protein
MRDNDHGAAPRGYAAIKALAQAQGCRIADVLALAEKNDPFFAGTPAHVAKAQWFAAMWQACGFTGMTGVHLRRVHYRIVSQLTDPRKHDGTAYENTEAYWKYMSDEASKAARHLGLVPPTAFSDHRNPPAHVPLLWTPDTRTPTLTWDEGFSSWRLPTIHTTLGDWLEFSLPSPRVDGYDYSKRDQPYHLEVWVEKTTMDDVLLPLCQRYGAVLVTGAGFQSLSSVIQLLQRVDRAGKPARIFYLSDFDPAGDAMPVAIARQIEFHRLQHAPQADIKLTPLGLTRAQVQRYGLPRIPIKETDTRKTNFEDRYGEGAVELDALEALYAGELATMLRTALDPYVDDALSDRLTEAEADAQSQVDDAWEEATAMLREALSDLEAEIEPIYTRYQERLEQLDTELQRELAPYQERLEALRHCRRGSPRALCGAHCACPP